MINATVMVPVIALFGFIDMKYFLLIIPFAFLGGLLFAAIGMCFTAVTPNIMSINYPVLLFITPMFLFSGTFFPLSALPFPVQYFATAFLPLTHIVNVIRSLAYGTLPTSLLFDIAWIVAVSSVLLVLSINLMKKRLVV
ncbi:MAG: ABC transporter permease [Methanolobus sp.]